MDWGQLLQMGAEYIRNNSDEATSSLDIDSIMNALGSIMGENGNFDIASLLSNLQDGSLMEIVSSWIGSGENAPIDPDKVVELVGSEKVEAFAQQLGLSHESAKQALADALPAVVDQATNEEPSLAEQLLDQVGGVEGAINLFKKLF